MHISETIEIAEGSVQFKGEISGKELDLIIQTGLLTLMQRGVISAIVKQKEDYTGEIH